LSRAALLYVADQLMYLHLRDRQNRGVAQVRIVPAVTRRLSIKACQKGTAASAG